jgi:hypothetical protein
VSLLLLALGFSTSSVIMRFAPYGDTNLEHLPRAQWVHAWKELAHNAWRSLAPHWWPIVLILAAAVGLLASCMPGVRRQALMVVRVCIVLITAAAVYGMSIGTVTWVQMNSFAGRYVTPAVILSQCALVTICAIPVWSALGSRVGRCVEFAIPPFLFLATAASYGLPSVAKVHKDLDQALGQRTPAIIASGCTHICGTYCNVWSSMFHANLILYENRQDKVIWGVTFRCLPSRDLWDRTPTDQLRIAAVAREIETTPYARYYMEMLCPLDLMNKVERDGLSLYRLRPGDVYWTWTDEFYGQEGSGENNLRWCSSQGRLVITNPKEESRAVTLGMAVRTLQEKPARLLIDGPLFSEQLEISGVPKIIRKSLKISPGTFETRFTSDADIMHAPGDYRTLGFCVIGFNLREQQDALTNGPLESATQDDLSNRNRTGQ